MRPTPLILLWSFTFLILLGADEKAILRFEPAKHPSERKIYVTGDTPEDLTKVRATLLAKGHAPVRLEVDPSSVSAFKLNVPDTITFTATDMPFLLIEYDGKPTFLMLKLEHELTVTLGEPECVDLPDAHAAVIVTGGLPLRNSREYVRERLKTIADTLKTVTGNDPGTLEVVADGAPKPARPAVKPPRFSENPGGFMWCFETDDWPEAASYDLSFHPPAGSPFEVSGKLQTTITRTQLQALRGGGSTGKVGERTFERNLDLSALLTSSVWNSSRTNQGALDLRLVPWLNWQATPVKERRKPIFFWTPVFLDAKVATGSITKDTLSANTIVVGSEAEMRYYFNTDRGDLIRTIFRFAHASDRDFKQAEVKGVFEVQPLPGIFWRRMKTRVDAKGKVRILPKSIGYELIPAVGAEVGRRYTEQFAAAPFPGMPAVRRLYWGGELRLDLTTRLRLVSQNRLYLRGEAWNTDRWHNWFSGEITVPLAGAWTAQHFFLSFERGALPPFSSADVNAVKAGYRVVMDGWFGLSR